MKREELIQRLQVIERYGYNLPSDLDEYDEKKLYTLYRKMLARILMERAAGELLFEQLATC